MMVFDNRFDNNYCGVERKVLKAALKKGIFKDAFFLSDVIESKE